MSGIDMYVCNWFWHKLIHDTWQDKGNGVKKYLQKSSNYVEKIHTHDNPAHKKNLK